MSTEPTAAAPSVETHQVFARIAAAAQYSANAAPPIEAGSALAGDDAALAPYHLSHAVWLAWTIAVDQLEAVRVLVEEAGRIQPWAHHTLLRSALENAGTALWLLQPSSRNDRIQRRLKLAAQDINDSAHIQKLTGLTPPAPGRSPAQRREEILSLAAERQLDPDTVLGRLGYGRILREAEAATSFKAGTLEILWSTGSGLAVLSHDVGDR